MYIVGTVVNLYSDWKDTTAFAAAGLS